MTSVTGFICMSEDRDLRIIDFQLPEEMPEFPKNLLMLGLWIGAVDGVVVKTDHRRRNFDGNAAGQSLRQRDFLAPGQRRSRCIIESTLLGWLSSQDSRGGLSYPGVTDRRLVRNAARFNLTGRCRMAHIHMRLTPEQVAGLLNDVRQFMRQESPAFRRP